MPDEAYRDQDLTEDARRALTVFAERRSLADADLSSTADQERRQHLERQCSAVARWNIVTSSLKRQRRVDDVLRAESMLPPRQSDPEM